MYYIMRVLPELYVNYVRHVAPNDNPTVLADFSLPINPIDFFVLAVAHHCILNNQ